MTQIVPISGRYGTSTGTSPRSYGIPEDVIAAVAARRRKKKPVLNGQKYYHPGPTPKPVSTPQPPAKPGGLYQALSDAEIQKLADERVQSELQSQADPIIRAKQEAANRALGTQAATIGFTKAAQDVLGGLGAPLGADYADATARMQGLGLSADAAPFADYQAEALQREGDAGTTWAGQLGKIEGNLGQEQLGGLMYQNEQDQKDFEQQLIDLAHQRPELRGKILDQLYQNEIAKLNIRSGEQDTALKGKQYLQSEADRLTNASGTIHIVNAQGKVVDTGQPTIQGRAETANETALGVKTAQTIISNQLDRAKLKLASQKNQIAIDKLNQQGARVDAAASKVKGHIVLMDGSEPQGADGGYIKVAPAAGGTVKATPFQKAVKDAKGLRGSPVAYPGSRVMKVPVLLPNGQPDPLGRTTTVRIKGKYIAAPGAKGVFSQPDPNNPGQYIRTTNSATKAKTSGTYTYQDALAYLTGAYGLSTAQAIRALRAAGWVA